MKTNCPICEKASQKEFQPFCSKRCSDIDLGRWLKGSYVIAGEDGEAMRPANDTDFPQDD